MDINFKKERSFVICQFTYHLNFVVSEVSNFISATCGEQFTEASDIERSMGETPCPLDPEVS